MSKQTEPECAFTPATGYATAWAVAKREDAKIAERSGYGRTVLGDQLRTLLRSGEVEVGWRACCGTMDDTMREYKAWLKVVKALKKDGAEATTESVKHKNAYATNNGGFWNSEIFRLKSHNGEAERRASGGKAQNEKETQK